MKFCIFLVILYLGIQVQCVNFDKLQSIPNRKVQSTETMILRTSDIGDTFYNLKQLPKQKLNTQKIFDSLHTLIQQIYSLKKVEEESYTDLKNLFDSYSLVANDEYNQSLKLYEQTKSQLTKYNNKQVQENKELEKKQSQQEKLEQDLKLLQNAAKKQNEQDEVDTQRLIEIQSIINDIVTEMIQEYPNKTKIDKYRVSFDSLLQKVNIPSKQTVQSRLQSTSSMQQEFNMNNSDKIKEQLQTKYKEIQVTIKREKDNAESLRVSNKKTKDVDIQDKKDGLSRLQSQIFKLEYNQKETTDYVEQLEEKLKILKTEIVILQESQSNQDKYLNAERNQFKEKASEFEDQLYLLRQCNNFYNSNDDEEDEEYNNSRQSPLYSQNGSL